MSDLLIAENLQKTYRSRIPYVGRDVEVLTGADITVNEAEIVGIVGENGAGKSTLMKMLTGVLQPDAGSVDRNCRIGWCPQETLLYDRLTVRETFRLFGTGYGMATEEISDVLDDLSHRLGFTEYIDYRVDRLSGGNQQKVNLSVALMHNPDLLLLDEPYTGFDWETYQTFWDLSEDLVDDGKAIVIISHFINERQHFDRILEIRDGVLHAEV